MIAPVISKEIEVILAIDTEHSNEVCRVSAVTEELNTHAWLHVRCLCVNRGS